MNAGPVATRGAGARAGGARAVHKRMMMAWMLALFFGVASYGMARTASQLVPHPHALEELSYYPSGAHLGVATLGHSESAADIAWLRAVQYYGGHRFTDNRFVRMEHVFDILTSLSPGFLPAYEFGSFALAQEGGDFPAAERLMLKGLEAKHVLRALARRRLPGQILDLPKHGFTAPVSQWVRDRAPMLQEKVLSANSVAATLVDVEVARRWLSDHVSERIDHGYAMWALWMLQEWHDNCSAVTEPDQGSLADATARSVQVP